MWTSWGVRKQGFDMVLVTRTWAVLTGLVLTAGLGVLLPTAVAPAASANPIACGFAASNSTGAAIPDNGSVTSTIDLTSLASNDPLVDLDVVLNISHTFDNDLEIALLYGGNTVLLANRRGGAGDNYTNTHFNGGAATSIINGTAPFNGSFRPEQSLNAFDDLDPSGVWSLRVRDLSGADIGTLDSWSLIMRTQWCNDSDRDTVKDVDDLCLSVKGVQPHGCPIRGRTVSISYNQTAKEFRGILRCSTAPRCADSQPVRIYQVAAGTDPLVARTFSFPAGNYAVRRLSVSGTYYAVAPKVIEEGVAECRRAQSGNLTL